MHLTRLRLSNFRSWASLDLDLTPGITLFVGPNGQGKTNLVEAIVYLATLASHRASADTVLVRSGATAAHISADLVDRGRSVTAELDLSVGKSNRARINGTGCRRVRDLAGVTSAVVFAPEDLTLVRGEPSDRRRSLDTLLVQRFPRFAGVRAEYDHVLRQRVALLKNIARSRASRDRATLLAPAEPGAQWSGQSVSDEDLAGLSTLDVWDGQLAIVGARLCAGRLRLLREWGPYVTDAYRRLAPESRPAAVGYRSCLGDDLSIPATPDTEIPEEFTEPEMWETALLAGLARRRTAELERGVCLTGPHRDDLLLGLGSRQARGYASHGESWSLALALRLAEYAYLRDEVAEPVLVLDDVFAELDRHRRRRLAEVARSAEQTLVTVAVGDDLPTELLSASSEGSGSHNSGVEASVSIHTVTAEAVAQHPEAALPGAEEDDRVSLLNAAELSALIESTERQVP